MQVTRHTVMAKRQANFINHKNFLNMKREIKTMEDFKNFPSATGTDSVVVDFEVLDFSELEIVQGGKGGNGTFGIICKCTPPPPPQN